MEPRSFDEMPRAIQALRERKTVILNLTMMEPDQAQRAVEVEEGADVRALGCVVDLLDQPLDVSHSTLPGDVGCAR